MEVSYFHFKSRIFCWLILQRISRPVGNILMVQETYMRTSIFTDELEHSEECKHLAKKQFTWNKPLGC